MLIVITHGSGQFGNRLIQFSNVLAYAIEHKCTLINLGFTEYEHLFQNLSNHLLLSYPLLHHTPFDFLREQHRFTIDERVRRLLLSLSRVNSSFLFNVELPYLKPGSLLNLVTDRQIKSSKILLLKGLKFQHPQLVEKHSDVIREVLCLKGHKKTSLNPAQANPFKPITIGLHIRQGDYRYWRKGKYFFTLEEYIWILRKFLTQISTNYIVKIFSNVAVDYEKFSEFSFVVGSGRISDDLCEMAECDLLIGPPSSFSFWASFMGKVPLYFVKYTDDIPLLENFSVNTNLKYDY
jgi:hypothetical protein